MKVFTVGFFGHRQVENPRVIEYRLEQTIMSLLAEQEYVVFLVGRGGEFDQYAASAVRRCRKLYRADNSCLVLVLPYMTAEYRSNEAAFHDYYDEVEICEHSSGTHFKNAYWARNCSVAQRADMIVACVQHGSGGAFKAVQYAAKIGCKVINLSGSGE